MSALQIGPYRLEGRACLAPMAGITDLPFRRICRRMGAALAAGEMLSADPRLWGTEESRRRRDHSGEMEPRVVQIAGGDPRMMADAALRNVDAGAQVIDVNMGCPAKKVCSRAAGSALLRDERLVADILAAVVAAVPEVPVTLKMRTGWSPGERNGVRIARIAEDCGVRLLSVHGRTRACRFEGAAEYDTIRAIVQSVSVPVIANGDITDTAGARAVLAHTGATAVMVGRAAQGRPWLCGSIDAALAGQPARCTPQGPELAAIVTGHIDALHAFYGETAGVRIARKHVGWYLRSCGEDRSFLHEFHRLDAARAQLAALHEHFAAIGDGEARAA